MKTFAEWAAIGRTVAKGEKARYRRVNEDRTKSVAVFEEDQTYCMDLDPGADWEVISVAEWDELQAEKKKPKVILGTRVVHDDELVSVWCGANKKAIKMMRSAGYMFDMHTHRWLKRGKPLDEIREGFEFKGFRVEVE